LLSAMLLTGCGQSAPPKPSGPLNVTVSILPQKYFINRIGGEKIHVNVMVGPGESPHTYEPKARQMTDLSNSSVYFKIGVEFEEAWMDRITSANPDMEIVDLSKEITHIPTASFYHENTKTFGDQIVQEQEENEHQHNDQTDPHIWTSPQNGILIAQQIYLSLAELDPENEPFYQKNLNDLLADINNLQSQIQSALMENGTDKFLVFHPAWGYFSKEFGLEQIVVEVGGTEPSARELAAVISEAQNAGIHVIFAQPEFNTQTAEYIAEEINGSVILISPLAENWLENLSLIAEEIAAAN